MAIAENCLKLRQYVCQMCHVFITTYYKGATYRWLRHLYATPHSCK